MGNCSTPKEKQQPKQQQQPVKKEVEAKSREIDFGAGGGAEKSLLQRAIEKEHGAARKLFHEMDGNGNGKLSLAEIDKAIDEKYPDCPGVHPVALQKTSLPGRPRQNAARSATPAPTRKRECINSRSKARYSFGFRAP
eukprot:Hpha_TRINITY_DN16206_c1_g3::TRINITY_DN16206_c1_g3_i8::g.15078::m.15078